VGRIRHFLRDETGATAIEYALLVGLIGLVMIKSLPLVGTKVSTVFGEVGNTLK
jgi:pilus assembly protein Flp/PilA